MSISRQNRPNSRTLSMGKFLKKRAKYLHTSKYGNEIGYTYNVGKNKAKREKRSAL